MDVAMSDAAEDDSSETINARRDIVVVAALMPELAVVAVTTAR